jgi:CRP-like cAMP-binding protein
MNPVLLPLPDFRVLQPDDRRWLEQSATQQTLAPGDRVIQEGESADFIYIVLEGSLGVSISQNQADVDQEIARCTVGEMVGEMSLMDDRPPSATVRAAEASQQPGFIKKLPLRCLYAYGAYLNCWHKVRSCLDKHYEKYCLCLPF